MDVIVFAGILINENLANLSTLHKYVLNTKLSFNIILSSFK